MSVGGNRSLDSARHLQPWHLAVVAVVALVVHVLTAGHPPFSSSSRYTLSVIEMARGGDWIVPHLAGVPYLEKPILTYWLGALSVLLFGEGDRAVHLPSGIATAITAMCAYALGTWAHSRRLGLVVGCGISATALVLAMGAVLTTDALLAACISVSWVGWALVLQGRNRLGLSWFWLGISLGYLTKGPVAIALPAAAVAGHAIMTGGWRGFLAALLRVRAWYGVPALLLINLPWTWAVWERDPRLVSFFYLYINLGSIASDQVNHPHPPFYYVPVFVTACLPLTAIAVPAFVVHSVQRVRASWTSTDQQTIATWCVAAVVFPFCFLSAVSSKLESYLLPLMPAVAVVVVVYVWPWATRVPRWAAIAGTIQGALLATASIAMWCIPKVSEQIAAEGRGIAMLAVACMGVSQAVMAVWLWRPRGLAIACTAASVGLVATAALVLPSVDTILPDRSSAPIHAYVVEHLQDQDLVIASGSCVHDYAIARTLDRRIAIRGSARELGLGHFVEVSEPSTPAPGMGNPIISDPYKVSGDVLDHVNLISEQEFRTVWQSPLRVWYYCRRGDPQDLVAEGLTVYQPIRVKHTLLVTNHPLPGVDIIPMAQPGESPASSPDDQNP